MVPFLVSKITASSHLSEDYLLSTPGKIYTFLNPVSYLDAMKHKDLYGQFDGVFADGSLLVDGIKSLYKQSVPRRSFDSTSLATEVFRYAAENGSTIYIVASRQRECERALHIIHEQYPSLQIVGYRNGYFNSPAEIAAEVEKILSAAPAFLVVGMGAIAQEQFLLAVKNAGFKGIGFTCGGFIHQTAKNKVYYYPRWIDKINIRFLYRAYKEPHTRLRYLRAIFLFPLLFTWERLTARQC